jgi:malate/lactate dehydrogenase
LRKLSSAASAASAICDHIRTWFSEDPEIHSMAVLSSGEYGIDEGLVFSYPVVCKNGEYKIIQGLKWSPEVKKRVETTLN